MEIKVENMYSCPFKGQHEFQYSEYTSGIDDVCLLLHRADCLLKKCPLRKEGKVTVSWDVKEL